MTEKHVNILSLSAIVFLMATAVASVVWVMHYDRTPQQPWAVSIFYFFATRIYPTLAVLAIIFICYIMSRNSQEDRS